MLSGNGLCDELITCPEESYRLWCVIVCDLETSRIGASYIYMTGRSPAEIVGSNPTGAWIFVCCECRVLSGRGLCDELITRPEESYRQRCVAVCDLETSRIGAPYIYNVRLLRVNIKLITKTNHSSKQYCSAVD